VNFNKLMIPSVLLKLLKIGLEKKRFKLLRSMRWPPQFLDLNPIENRWDYVHNQIWGKNYSNIEDLFDALNKAWKTLEPAYADNLMKFIFICFLE
jgi:hypothetical protein